MPQRGAKDPTPPPSSPGILEYCERFIAAEEELGLWNHTVGGTSWWHQVRYELFGRVLMLRGLMGRRQGNWSDRSWYDWLVPRPGHTLRALGRWRWGDIGPADLLVASWPRHMLRDGQWVDPISGPLLEAVPHSRWVVEDVHQGRHYHPMDTPNLKYLEWQWLLASFRDSVTGGLWRNVPKGQELGALKELAVGLGERLEVALPAQDLAKLASGAVRELRTFGTLYGRLLDRTRPRLVLQVVHYSRRNMPLTLAARAQGIPVVELQHGVIGPAHLAYNFAPGRCPPSFPDWLLTFGDWWREVTPGLPLPEDRVRAVGYDWLNAHRRDQPGTQSGSVQKLLFVSQGSIGEALSRVAAEVASRLTNDGVIIRYKLHPSECLGWRKRYPWLVTPGLEVVDTPTSIYEEFRRVDAQVGVYSTAVFEGLAFGLRTFVMALPGHEALRDIYESGVARLVTGAEELAGAVMSAEVSAPPSESIWAEDAPRRFREFVDEVA